MSTNIMYYSAKVTKGNKMKQVEDIRRGIKRRIADLNSSRERTAKSAGIATQTIQTFLAGNTDIRISTLAKYCEDGLGTSLDEIIRLGQ